MNGLVDGQIILNNEPLAVIPNSVTRRLGRAETTVKTQSLGAGNVDTVHSSNQETAKSYFKCSVAVTKANIERVDSAKMNLGANVIRYIAEGRTEIYEQMSITNDPEYPDSNDGVIEVEFEGKPVIS